jgi:ABC-2 type transport system ATP-binding protein
MSTPVLEAVGLSKQYGRKWALRDCTFAVPAGSVTALVGPNGSGKSTLLRTAAGLSRPTGGTMRILGQDATASATRPRIGYLDQNRLLYKGFRIREIFTFGAEANPAWDMGLASDYVGELGLDLNARIQDLSGGQQAQVALVVAMAKRPEVLLLDEPAAALDPVAREDLLRLLMQQVAASGVSVIISTHALSDVERICDYLVVLTRAEVALAEETAFVLSSHRLLESNNPSAPLPAGARVISTVATTRGVRHLVQLSLPLVDDGWICREPTLDEILLGYLRSRGLHDVADDTTQGAF